MSDKTQMLFEHYYMQEALTGWVKTVVDAFYKRYGTSGGGPEVEELRNMAKELETVQAQSNWRDTQIRSLSDAMSKISDKINKMKNQEIPQGKGELIRAEDKFEELSQMRDKLWKEYREKEGRAMDLSIEFREQFQKLTSKKVPDVKRLIQEPNPFIVGGAIALVAAALGVAAYKVYKAYFSKAARACKGKSGKEKSNCMTKYKIDALMKAKSLLVKKGSSCAKAKDPKKCKAEMQKQLDRFDKKINKAKTSLKEGNVMLDKTQMLFEQYFVEALTEKSWLDKINTGAETLHKKLGDTKLGQSLQADMNSPQAKKDMEKFEKSMDTFQKKVGQTQISKDINTAVRQKVEADTGRPYEEVMRDIEKALEKKPESIFSNPSLFQILAISVLVAGLSVAAYKIYQYYFSKAAKACQGKQGSDKTKCMKQYRIAALIKARDILKKQVSNCSKSRDPQKCKAGIMKKVAKFDKKINKAKASLKEGNVMLDDYLNYIQENPAAAAPGMLSQAAGLASKYGMLVYTVPFIIGLAMKPMKAIFDKAEKTCKGLAPEDYAKCKKKFKMQGIQAAISKLNSEKSKCQKTKNPQECMQKIAAKIQQLKGKMSAIQG